MAEEASGGWLTRTFTKVSGWAKHHLLSPTMLIMMAVMALPAVSMAATAVAGKATLGDLGLSLLDHYWAMIKAPFAEAGTLGDIFNNTVNGNLAASSYQMGGAHAAHGAVGATAHGAAGHVADAAIDQTKTSLCSLPFNEVQATLAPEKLEAWTTAADKMGKPVEEFFTERLCAKHH